MCEYQKKKGMSEIDAIFEYVKMARGLETFGIHFFLVRVKCLSSFKTIHFQVRSFQEQQKGRQKMVPLLMGVSKDKILRLDTSTKKPKEELELRKVLNYACTDKILKVNFRDKAFTVQTSEGQKIQDLIEGYTLQLREKQKAEQKEKEQAREKKAEKSQDPIITVLKDKIKPKIDHSKRILNKPEELALTDDPK